MPHTQILEAKLAILAVIDVQERMVEAIEPKWREVVLANIGRMIETAGILEIPVLHTEQYPQGLGHTVAVLRERLPAGPAPIVKTTCSCWRDAGFRQALERSGRTQVILAGLETHVCIQQTALDLLRVNHIPFVPADAVGSRRDSDMTTALARMARAGAEVSTAESLIFEMVERCDHPRFKDILKLVK